MNRELPDVPRSVFWLDWRERSPQGGAGADANAGAFWAQNEALNNADQHKGAKGLVGKLLDVIMTPSNVRARVQNELLLVQQKQSGNQPPAAPNKLIVEANDGPPRSGAGGSSLLVPIICATPIGPFICGLFGANAPGTSGSQPRNVTLSNTNGEGSGSDAGGRGGASRSINSTNNSIPGRVQSRINVTNDGLEHVAERHFDTTVNASQFTISEGDLTNILQRRETVSTSVSKVIEISDGLRYIREINVRRVIGADKFNNFEPTSILNVVADEYVNLVSAFPGGAMK